ncbi:LEAF RUST 10 DISEASE-RESISTANCE LOCUS RECEPTOR-LIKE PROTEIN KINASE-like 1.2 [Arachis stenosperma]|uniref:LEAF RUST 10 DISEASE-RESISTANCE LOCUS RECEPTOR-LIKE PROTEIN KINASE-like 1.2 n=1 Tax=Arachis stenosperma TaxID=217475 RepID=UPI0025ACE469|nr:LEAF RUST 10 DISEASE-RESISTANCE LOCUS RECEPTOR-LIKE PROTEIN KINASE-like 1.2 [Arachis stenosperma]
MAELALNCMGFPQELRPNMEQVLDILNGKRLERYKTIEGRVSYRSDVYSFGVVLFEFISSKPAFWREVPHGEAVGFAKFAIIKLLNNTLKELVDPDIGYDSDKDVPEMVTAVAELAFQCIQCPKELRPSMKQVLETLEGIKKGTWGFNQII